MTISMMYYVFQVFLVTFYQYQITHSGEGKTIEFSPHQVVIKDLKYAKHVLAIGIPDDITRL